MQKSENLKPEKMVDSSTFRFQVSALRPPPFPLHPRCDGVASGHDEKKTARDHAAVGKGQRPERARKDPICTKSRRNSRRAVEDARELSPLAELVHAFVAESIRFQVAGMSAAILQGVPATTLDTDLWIEPARKAICAGADDLSVTGSNRSGANRRLAARRHTRQFPLSRGWPSGLRYGSEVSPAPALVWNAGAGPPACQHYSKQGNHRPRKRRGAPAIAQKNRPVDSQSETTRTSKRYAQIALPHSAFRFPLPLNLSTSQLLNLLLSGFRFPPSCFKN